MICQSALGGCKSGFILIFFVDIDLIITRKIVHEGKDFITSTCIYYLVNKLIGEVIFGISQIQIMQFNTNTNGSLFFINGNKIGNPSGIRDGVYETYFTQFFDLNFDGGFL